MPYVHFPNDTDDAVESAIVHIVDALKGLNETVVGLREELADARYRIVELEDDVAHIAGQRDELEIELMALQENS